MAFLEIGTHTHLHINPTLPNARSLLITHWLLSPAMFYYIPLEGKGLACSTGSVSCLGGGRSDLWLFDYYSLTSFNAERTDYGRNTNHWFSFNLECRGVNGTFWVLGGILGNWIVRFLSRVCSLQLGLNLWAECGSLCRLTSPSPRERHATPELSHSFSPGATSASWLLQRAECNFRTV